MSKIDVAKEQIAYLKLWLGVLIVVGISLISWLFGNFQSAAWPLIAGDLLGLVGLLVGCLVLHRRIESKIAQLGEW